jgi:predicted kinase
MTMSFSQPAHFPPVKAPSHPQGKTVILVNGIPASGKSSIARQLAQDFTLPLLTLDGIKEPFMARLGPVDREQNRMLGRAAYEALWLMVTQAPARCIYVIDAWFGFQSKDVLCRYLSDAGVVRVLEVWNQISGERAAERYLSRLAQRPPGHPGAEYLPELRALAALAGPMALGPVLSIDQDQAIDIRRLRRWLQAQGVPRRQRYFLPVVPGRRVEKRCRGTAPNGRSSDLFD